MSQAGVVVTQLIVDASGAKMGVDQYVAQMDRAKKSAMDTGQATATSFEAAQRKWQNSLAATDPVIRAQIKMEEALNKQRAISKTALDLGIGTQAAHAAQLERVRAQYQGYVDSASRAQFASTGFGKAVGMVTTQLTAMAGVISVGAVLAFAKASFDMAAGLDEAAQQAGVSTKALQAYRAELNMAGISTQQTDMMLTRLTRTIGSALEKSGPARDAFNELGISVNTLRGGAEAAMPAIAQALLKIPDAATRARIEVDLFSRSGQRLESALKALVDPTSTLIERQEALGHVLGTEVTEAADKSADRLAAAWDRAEKAMGGAVSRMLAKIFELIDAQKQVEDQKLYPENGYFMFQPQGEMKTRAQLDAEAAARKKAAADAERMRNGIPTLERLNAPLLVNGKVPGANDNFSSPGEDKLVANMRVRAELAQLTNQRQAEAEAIIARANQKLEEGTKTLYAQDGSVRKYVTSLAEASGLLTESEKKQTVGLARTIAQAAATDKLKETYKGYVATLADEARIAGLSTPQRAAELSVIKAAQIVQKERGVEERNIVQTYQRALTILTPIQKAEVERMEAAKATAQFQRQIANELDLAQTAAKASREDRELAVQLRQKELELGRALTAEEKNQLEATQAIRDTMQLGDYMDDLREGAQLAGLSADERERELAVLQQIEATHGKITDAEKDQIRGHIANRQEMEKQRELVDGIAGGFQDFFADVLTTGKASFSNLWQTIQNQFVQMLAYMASQALIQPIIIPMVQEFFGGGGTMGGLGSLLGLTGPGGSGAGGMGAMGMLSNASSLSSLIPGGGLSGLTGSMFGGMGLMNGLGSALGFGTSSIAGLAGPGMTMALPMGGTTTISGALPSLAGTSGSLFGGLTLGGLAGGMGLGMLGSSLLFGNKNDAKMGGMGGSALGALAGTFLFPGVGTVLGGLLGGLAGGGLGSLTGSSNQGAISNFTNGGLGNTLFKAGGGDNSKLATAATGTVNQAIKALQAAGVSVSMNGITGLSIGSDKSYIYDAAGGKQKLGGGDVEGVVKGILDRILNSASGSTPEAQAVLGKYQSNGGITSANVEQLISDLGAAKNFADSLSNLKEADKVLTEASGRIAQINQEYEGLVAQASELGISIDGLTNARQGAFRNLLDGYLSQLDMLIPANGGGEWAARAKAIETAEKNAAEAATALGSGLDEVTAKAGLARTAMAEDFNKQVQDAMLAMTDPALLAYNQMLDVQTQRLAAATAAGADLNAVMQLNTMELNKAREQQDAKRAADEAEALAKSLQRQADATSAAARAAMDAADAMASMSEFNKSIAIEIMRFTDPAGADYQQLLVNQGKRVHDAIMAGADITAVYQLNKLEQDRLMAQVRAQELEKTLGDMFKTLGVEVGTLNDVFQNAAQTARQSANQWASAKDSLTRASTALLVSDQSLSPQDRYTNSRAELDRLKISGRTDPDAARDFASFAGQFLQTSFQFNGSNSAYGSDYNYVQDSLSELASFSQTQTDLATRQAESAEAALKVLEEIKNGLADQSKSSLEAVAVLTKEVTDLKQQVKNGNLQARQ